MRFREWLELQEKIFSDPKVPFPQVEVPEVGSWGKALGRAAMAGGRWLFGSKERERPQADISPPTRRGELESYRGKNMVKAVYVPSENLVYGTDGAIFKPGKPIDGPAVGVHNGISYILKVSRSRPQFASSS